MPILPMPSGFVEPPAREHIKVESEKKERFRAPSLLFPALLNTNSRASSNRKKKAKEEDGY